MSWQPALSPDVENAPSCKFVDTVIIPRARDLGGFQVRRVLPSAQRRMVGPFIFFDQMGPIEFLAGKGIDVRPHPHIGLATVTYLLRGTIVHRDSLGSLQPIAPGDVNWMTAGRGIVHSERSPPEARRQRHQAYGVQIWVALPERYEEAEPDFAHHAASDLPLLEGEGKRVRIVAGSLFGRRSPVKTLSALFQADARLAAGRSLPLDPDYDERAAYILEGEVEIAGERFAPGRLLVFRPGERVTIGALTPARLIVLGGDPMDGPRHIWWNFVSSRRERIEEAKQAWKNGRFDAVPGDAEFIPLPEQI